MLRARHRIPGRCGITFWHFRPSVAISASMAICFRPNHVRVQLNLLGRRVSPYGTIQWSDIVRRDPLSSRRQGAKSA